MSELRESAVVKLAPCGKGRVGGLIGLGGVGESDLGKREGLGIVVVEGLSSVLKI